MPTPENLATDATVAIMLADGFETVEALAVADILFRACVRTDLISVTDARHVTSSHGIRVVADLMLEDVDLSTYTVLFLPGGLPGTTNLKATPAIQAEVLRRADEGEAMAAICAAPSIFAELGVLDGRHATANPAFIKAIAAGGAIVHDNPVVIDDFITTSRGAGTSIDLGLEIVRQLLGEDAAEAISRGIVRTH
nr:DJ-1 family glyoxalase III [uncultured Actinomyces sp.]